MSGEYNFQKELKDSIFNADPKLNRNELLEDIFKSYVAKLLEIALMKNDKNKLESAALHEIRRSLISEFRKTELSEFQKTVEYYEHLFDKTIEEIFNDASKAHEGEDKVGMQQTLEVDPRAYINEGGLFVPAHMKKG